MEARKALEVEPASPSAHYLGYPTVLTRSSEAAASHATTAQWKEPACRHEAQASTNEARAAVVAERSRGGEAKAAVATESFEIRETTGLKAGAARRLEVHRMGTYKVRLDAQVGRGGHATAEAKVSMRLEEFESSSGEWRKAAAAPIAELRKVAGQAAMGREVGTPGDNPHWGGFERTTTINPLIDDALYAIGPIPPMTTRAENAQRGSDGLWPLARHLTLRGAKFGAIFPRTSSGFGLALCLQG
jgi:hypothetical protein